MNKIILIIKREYLTRVRKRSFLLTTFLVPLFFIAMYAGIIYLTKKSFDEAHGTVYIIDQQGQVAPNLKSTKNITYILENKALQEQLEILGKDSDKASVLVIPEDFYSSRKVEFLSSGKVNISIQKEIQNELSNIIKNQEFIKLGLNIDSLNNIKSEVFMSAKEIGNNGDTKQSSTEVAMGISIVLSVLIYLSLFLYGAQVMRGIIEEKSSRIIEVIISSVKPFQLMLGKIIGIGLVGLTQFFLWALLTVSLAGTITAFLANKTEVATELMSSNVPNISGNTDISTSAEFAQSDIIALLSTVNVSEIVISFFVFFLGGYLLYSALFAAVGSAIDSETEATQFTMPITMPLLLTYALSFGVLINDPHGSVATWLSFIPLTSPIAMLVRIPFGVPTWQIILSASILAVSFILTTWAAARIYRVGILMYGKKASIKELIKWFNYKS